MSGSRSIAVLGPIPRDRITTHNGEVFEKYGCALYTVAALAALLDDNDRILPIVHVRRDDEDADQGAALRFPQRRPDRHPLRVRPRRGRRAHLHRPGQPDRAADRVHGPDHARGRRVRAARRRLRLRADHRLRGRPGDAGLHQVPQRRHDPARRPRPDQHVGHRWRASAAAVGGARLVAAPHRPAEDEPRGGRVQLVPVADRARTPRRRRSHRDRAASRLRRTLPASRGEGGLRHPGRARLRRLLARRGRQPGRADRAADPHRARRGHDRRRRLVRRRAGVRLPAGRRRRPGRAVRQRDGRPALSPAQPSTFTSRCRRPTSSSPTPTAAHSRADVTRFLPAPRHRGETL